MRSISCFVVDDEKEACFRLKDIIEKFPELDFLGYEQNADQAVTTIIQKKPDLIFLDVEMPCKTGFDILQEVRSHTFFPTVIFVTNSLLAICFVSSIRVLIGLVTLLPRIKENTANIINENNPNTMIWLRSTYNSSVMRETGT
jgi:CheY-like chemotaxis protein